MTSGVLEFSSNAAGLPLDAVISANKNMTQPTRLKRKNMTRATRSRMQNMRQATRLAQSVIPTDLYAIGFHVRQNVLLRGRQTTENVSERQHGSGTTWKISLIH